MWHMSVSLPKKMPRKKVFVLTREDYAAICRAVTEMIRVRSRTYGLSAEGKPFVPYTPGTAAKKKPIPDDEAPWADLVKILRGITDRMARFATTDEERKPFQRQLGYFWREINAKKKEYYEELVTHEQVNLTVTGEMLSGIREIATTAKARAYDPIFYARWVGGGSKPRKDKTGKNLGSLPRRPFMGFTEDEELWIIECFVQPLIDFIQVELGKLLFGTKADDVRPNPQMLLRRAYQEMPSKEEDMS